MSQDFPEWYLLQFMLGPVAALVVCLGIEGSVLGIGSIEILVDAELLKVHDHFRGELIWL